MRLLFILFLVFGLAGCSSIPKKNLESRPGVIAATFSVEESVVKDLMEEGYSNEQIVKILIIDAGTSLDIERIKEEKKNGKSLEDIAGDAGIPKELLEQQAERIINEIPTYLKE